jgi:hypothetical protein
MELTPMERELLKSVSRLIEQSNDSATAIRHSADKIATATRRDVDALAACVSSLAECQMRLVDWCRASAAEAAVDGSATRALAQVQQDLQHRLKALG